MTVIATFNVNSAKARAERILEWLASRKPDFALLQEIKSTEENFQYDIFEKAGYHSTIVGQKSYNGVAVLSKTPVKTVFDHLPAYDIDNSDDHARFLQVESKETGLNVACVYAPNGNPVYDENGNKSEKFAYKLRFLQRLKIHIEHMLANRTPFIIGGDFNVIPEDIDVYDPKAMANDALAQPESKALLRQIIYTGMYDCFRMIDPQARAYTFWDYQRGAWQKDEGFRIDFLLASPDMADVLDYCATDRKERGKERPSDHIPLWASFK